MKLIRFLVLNNIDSRRNCLKLLDNEKVMVNGKICRSSAFEIDRNSDHIIVNGLPLRGLPEMFYIALNKPRGVVVTKHDPGERATVYDYLYDKGMFRVAADARWSGLSERKIYAKFKTFLKSNLLYAGRLDINTMGLLIVTNDSEMINRLTHPSFGKDKVYRVKISHHLKQKEIDTFKKGIYLANESGKRSKFTCKFIRITSQRSDTVVVISVRSGENRIIRRAFKQMGHPVITLKRIEHGGIRLQGIKIGAYRFLTEKEVTQLKAK